MSFSGFSGYNQVSWQVDEEITSAKLQQMCTNSDILAATTPKQFYVMYQELTGEFTNNRGRPLGSTVPASNMVAAYGTVDFGPDQITNLWNFAIQWPAGLWTYPPIVTCTASTIIKNTTQAISCAVADDTQVASTLFAMWYPDFHKAELHCAINILALGY